MNEWGSKAQPNEVLRDPQSIHFLDWEWNRTSNPASQTHTLFLSIPSLPRVRGFGQKPRKKNVDVCLQGYMSGLILEDVFQQILSSWTKPKGYRFKMDFLQPTLGEACWGSLKASPCYKILSRSNPLSTHTASQNRMKSNLKDNCRPSGSRGRVWGQRRNWFLWLWT